MTQDLLELEETRVTDDGKLIDVYRHRQLGHTREKILAEDGELVSEWRDEIDEE